MLTVFLFFVQVVQICSQHNDVAKHVFPLLFHTLKWEGGGQVSLITGMVGACHNYVKICISRGCGQNVE